MKILQITESLEIGGAERVVATLCNELRSQHSVAVVCLKQIGALADTLHPDISVVCLDKGEGQDLGAFRRLVDLMRRQRPDVVHSHDWGCYLDAMLAARLAGVGNAVHTVHGRYMAGGSGTLARVKRELRHWLERRAEVRFGNVVCVSDTLRAHVAAEVGIPQQRMTTICNGIDFSGGTVAPERLPQQEALFVAVGRLAEVKNFPLMIRAFAAVRHAAPVRLQIVGDGPQRPALEALVQSLGVADAVEFLGFRSDVDALLSRAHAFLLSSTSEGIPMSILEAMRCACPVVATDVGGVAMLVESGTTGLLVPSGDETAFADALRQLIGNPQRAHEMGLAGRQKGQQQFSVSAMVQGYERLYAGSADRGR